MAAARPPKLTDRTSGVLLHPTSLPGGGSTGDLGPQAYHFLDFLVDAGQRWWQTLPVGPTGYADSPYSPQSAFAGNPMLTSAARRVADGLLGAADRPRTREQQLRPAFAAFRSPRRDGGYADFAA